MSDRGRVAGVDPGSGATPVEGLRDLASRTAELLHDRWDADAAGDPLRGLYISDAEVARATGSAAEDPAWDDAEVADRLDRIGALFGLDRAEREALLVIVAPDLDERFERIYAYLHDDVARRRASIGLCLESLGWSRAAPDGRAIFDPRSPLVGQGLVVVDEPDRPFLTRSLRGADVVAAYLSGLATVDAALVPLATILAPEQAGLPLEGIPPVVYLHERRGSSGRVAAADRMGALGLPALVVDIDRAGEHVDVGHLGGLAARDAALLGCGLVIGPIRTTELQARALDFAGRAPGPVVLYGRAAWDPAWCEEPVVVETLVPDGPAAREKAWRAALTGRAKVDDVLGAVSAMQLDRHQMAQAVAAAALEGEPISPASLQQAARRLKGHALERLADRHPPGPRLADVVVPDTVAATLRRIVGRVRQRDLVIDSWGLGGPAGATRGVTALFAGVSGTGKTLSALAIAGELGLDLYAVNLAAVVDKYIGETEKNLDRIFEAAEGIDGVLLFDEADALFGKRSEVSDARDRYANIEVAYLLQRMEAFDGLAVLTTNLRGNLDDAFTRRLGFIIELPPPDRDQRLRLWEAHLPASLPVADDLDLDQLAGAFELAGGSIRNAVLAAGFYAADRDGVLRMADLETAAHEENRKLGRLELR